MHRQIIKIIFFTISILTFATNSYAKISDFWESAPKATHNRYNQALMNGEEKWILTFADSLDILAKETNQPPYEYYAEQLRTLHYFCHEDSVNFSLHSNNAQQLALKCKFYNEYFLEKVNSVNFYFRIGYPYMGQKEAKNIVEEAKKMEHQIGISYGLFTISFIYSKKKAYKEANKKIIEAYRIAQDSDEFPKTYCSMLLSTIAMNCIYDNQYSEAGIYARKALNINKDNITARAILAQSYYYQKDYDAFAIQADSIQKIDSSGLNEMEAAVALRLVNIYKNIIASKYDEALNIISSEDNYDDRYIHSIDVYKRMGKWEKAYDVLQEYMHYNDSISQCMNSEEMAEMNAELITIYNLRKKDAEIVRQNYSLHFFGLIVVIIAIVVTIIIARYIHLNKKNKALVEHISQLVEYKKNAKEKELTSRRHHIVPGTQNEGIVRIMDEAALPQEDETESETKVEDEALEEGQSVESIENEGVETENEKDYSDIKRFLYEFTKNKLFTDPNFNREMVLERLHIRKRTFARDFEEYAGVTFTKFLMTNRLEYSVELMKENPDYTLEAIAEMSGIPSRTSFHRNFTLYFGITASEFRKQLRS
ncbi:MAG: helix-turn-helix domain-containing protein [Bacteroidaceae bacterium]|nr:helix-turn-helix domain-containing protein [Bacteroidaceae bacterium]